MHRIILLIPILLLSATVAMAQTDDVPPQRIFYKDTPEWKTYKALNIAGWSALGVGTATAMFGGLLQGLVSVYGDGNGYGGPSDFTGIPMICVAVGGSLMVASVPMLIIARRYKNKAKSITLGAGVTQITTVTPLRAMHATPALSVSLTF